MSKKRAFTGLTFNYVIDQVLLKAKFKTIEEFLETIFPKNNNPKSPNDNSEISNIRWKKYRIDTRDSVKTVADLKILLINEPDAINPPKKPPKTLQLIRKQKYSIEEVKEAVKDVLFETDDKKARIEFDGDYIKGNSQRYQTFFTDGVKCSCCGIEGKFFAKERHSTSKCYHLNLYAVDDNGIEILMTKDHIIPKSKGGKNHLSNYQTMCSVCNSLKGNRMENE